MIYVNCSLEKILIVFTYFFNDGQWRDIILLHIIQSDPKNATFWKSHENIRKTQNKLLWQKLNHKCLKF